MKIFRILAQDSGGTKGLWQAYIMKFFCELVGIPFKNAQGQIDPNGDYCDLYRYIPLITGSSIGGIASCAYAFGYSPNFVIKFLKQYGPQIFTSTFGTPMPTWRKTQALGSPSILGGIDCYNGGSFYGAGSNGDQTNPVMLQALIDAFGDSKLSNLKTNVIITAVDVIKRENTSPLMRPVLLSNLLLPDLEGYNLKIVDAVLASSAAPYYLPPRTIDQKIYIDGGLVQSNPAMIGYSYGQALGSGSSSFYSLLSVGCGLSTIGFFDPNQPPPSNIDTNISNNINYGNDIIDMGITGSQEFVHQNLKILSKFSSNLFYLRYQTFFDPNINTETDNTSTEFQNYMYSSAQNSFVLEKQKTLAFVTNSRYNS